MLNTIKVKGYNWFEPTLIFSSKFKSNYSNWFESN
jgi:hypothetical protein